jgi:DNA-binding transcriptional regulator LsrR (DeoR family)
MTFRLHVIPASHVDQFCDAASRHLANLLESDQMTIGTMYGKTVSQLIDGIGRYRAATGDRGGIRVIPLAGDPLYLLNQQTQEVSASHLAAKLERILVGASRDLPSLTGVPAYVSWDFVSDPKKHVVINEFLKRIPGYAQIFCGIDGPPYIEQLDTVISGVGIITSSEKSTAAFIRERELQDKEKFSSRKHLVLGDIAGVLLPKPELSDADKAKLDDLNQGWKGVQLNHLRNVARRARPGGPTGVIVAAFSKEKAPIVREAVIRGLVNNLVVDDSLAGAIEHNLRHRAAGHGADSP